MDANDSPAQLCCTAAYQSLIGGIGWLATGTRPDLSPVHSFLSFYNSKPLTGHMQAALYALQYIHSTHDHGIHFTLSDTDPIHTFMHFPDLSDVDAYTDAKLPLLHIAHLLHPIVMLVGALRLVWPSGMELYFLFSRLVA
jgi:hypothetical protein